MLKLQLSDADSSSNLKVVCDATRSRLESERERERGDVSGAGAISHGIKPRVGEQTEDGRRRDGDFL